MVAVLSATGPQTQTQTSPEPAEGVPNSRQGRLLSLLAAKGLIGTKLLLKAPLLVSDALKQASFVAGAVGGATAAAGLGYYPYEKDYYHYGEGYYKKPQIVVVKEEEEEEWQPHDKDYYHYGEDYYKKPEIVVVEEEGEEPESPVLPVVIVTTSDQGPTGPPPCLRCSGGTD